MQHFCYTGYKPNLYFIALVSFGIENIKNVDSKKLFHKHVFRSIVFLIFGYTV